MFERWLDRDDVTEEDLRELTAEEEVLDWMAQSPVPQPRRRDWLAEDVATPIPPVRRAAPVARPRRRSAVLLVAFTFIFGTATGGLIVGLAAALWMWA